MKPIRYAGQDKFGLENQMYIPGTYNEKWHKINFNSGVLEPLENLSLPIVVHLMGRYTK